MVRSKAWAIAAVACAAVTLAAWSQEPAPGERPRPDVSIGAGVVFWPTPYEDVDTKVFPIPIGSLRYGRLWIEGVRLGYRVFGGRGGGLDVFARPRFDGFDPDDGGVLAGMDEREESVEAGLALSLRRQHFEVRLSATADVLDRNEGSELALESTWPFEAGRFRLTPGVALLFGDDDLIDYYYGVRLHEVTADRPAYSPGSTLTARASLNATRRIGSSHWSVVTLLNVNRPGEEIRDSPIVDASVTAGIFAGFLYTF
jgi:outer membrane protein